jgi:SNF2 family DNA or RNA helicase
MHACSPPAVALHACLLLLWRRDPEAGLLPLEEVQARLSCMPVSLAEALLPFQVQGVAYGVARRGRCLIADEMGVGKTLQAIALAACYQVSGCN